MDFLEGFLLGPIWSDTEYETRRHTGFYWLIGWLIFAGYLWLQFKPPIAQPWLDLPSWTSVFVFFFLLCALPFACRYYYQLNFLIKIPILAIQVIKLAAAFLALYQWALPLYTLDIAALPDQLIEYINTAIAKATETFSSLGDAIGMMVGIIAGGLQVVLTLVGIILAATLIPALFLFMIQLLQRGMDYLVQRTLFQQLDI